MVGAGSLHVVVGGGSVQTTRRESGGGKLKLYFIFVCFVTLY